MTYPRSEAIHVLILSEDSKNARYLSRQLRGLGYRVSQAAEDGETDIPDLQDGAPVVALLPVDRERFARGPIPAVWKFGSRLIPVLPVAAFVSSDKAASPEEWSRKGIPVLPIQADDLHRALMDSVESTGYLRRLADSEARLKAQYKGNPLPTFSFRESKGRLVLDECNDAAKAFLLLADEKGLEEKFDVLFPGQTWLREKIQLCLADRIPVEFEDWIRSGSRPDSRFVEGRCVFLPSHIVTVYLHDLTDRHLFEEALKRSEERSRTLIESMNEGLTISNPEGVIVYANRRYAEIVGRKVDQIVGRHASAFSDEADRRILDEELEKRRSGKNDPYELPLLRPDGSLRFVLISPRALFNEDEVYAGSIAVITDLTERRMMEERLRRQQRELRDLSRHLQSVRETEARRIAREIHDELGQSLTALRMDVSWIVNKLSKEAAGLAAIRAKAGSMTGVIEGAMRSLQRISAELRPGLLDNLGLIPAMEWQAAEFSKRSGIRCQLSLGSEDLHLDQDRATALFRIFQEACTNSWRHSEASRIWVSLRRRTRPAPSLVLTVRDNGRGIRQEEISSPRAFGLMGIRERLRAFDGQLDIRGKAGKGTTIKAVLPVF